MPSFLVPDMTCGHCVAALSRALQEADPSARIDIDLPAHRVQVEGGVLDGQRLAALIADAGYTPQPVPA